LLKYIDANLDTKQTKLWILVLIVKYGKFLNSFLLKQRVKLKLKYIFNIIVFFFSSRSIKKHSSKDNIAKY